MKNMAVIGVLLLLITCSEQGKMNPASQANNEKSKSSEAALDWILLDRNEGSAVLEAAAVVRAPQSVADVSLPYRARITRLRARVGDTVKAGNPIVDVVAPEVIDAAAVYLSASQQLGVYRERSENLEKLQQEGIVDKARVQSQQKTQAQTRADMKRALAILRSSGQSAASAPSILNRGYMVLTAPIPGVVSEINAHVGEIYNVGEKPMAKIVGQGNARIEVQTLGPFPQAESFRFVDATGERYPLSGKPLSIVSKGDGTKTMWFALSEDTSLPDGLPGKVQLESEDGIFEVPKTALRAKGGTQIVYRDRDGKRKDVQVFPIAETASTVFVRGELKFGDRVASSSDKNDL